MNMKFSPDISKNPSSPCMQINQTIEVHMLYVIMRMDTGKKSIEHVKKGQIHISWVSPN